MPGILSRKNDMTIDMNNVVTKRCDLLAWRLQSYFTREDFGHSFDLRHFVVREQKFLSSHKLDEIPL